MYCIGVNIMTENKKQFDENFDLKVSDRLKSDLGSLFKAEHSVPPEIDRAILDKASKRFVRPKKRIRVFRWAGSVAAAAAIIIVAFVFFFQSDYITPMSTMSMEGADIDRSGRVDILDAFKLAKQIQSVNNPDKKWDINGDGLVNRGDVDFIASAAVKINKGVI
jgi:hypothetical protein